MTATATIFWTTPRLPENGYSTIGYFPNGTLRSIIIDNIKYESSTKFTADVKFLVEDSSYDYLLRPGNIFSLKEGSHTVGIVHI